MTPALHKIAALVRSRQGRHHAISAPEIAAKTGIPERSVRSIISTSPSFQPCAIPGNGYFWPDRLEEIHAHDSTLAKQEDALKKRRRIFRAFWKHQGISFPDPSPPTNTKKPI